MRPLCLGCNTTCMCGCGGDLWPGAFFSLCLGCMCGCGGDNGGGVRVPRPLFLVPPAPLPHSQLQLFLSLCVPHSQTKPNSKHLTLTFLPQFTELCQIVKVFCPRCQKCFASSGTTITKTSKVHLETSEQTMTLLMWLWYVRMVSRWKHTKWSWQHQALSSGSFW